MHSTSPIEQTEPSPQPETSPLPVLKLPQPALLLMPEAEILVVPVPEPPSHGTPANLPSLSVLPVRSVGRNGKIARLPQLERDMVNRMLRNNRPHKIIAAALDELDFLVTERNISNWKTRGGYKEWCREQERALQIRLEQDNLLEFVRKKDASQLPEIGLQVAATEISKLLLRPETQQQLTANPQKYSHMISSLCRLSAQLHTLQKYRDDSARELGRSSDPERVRREHESEVESVRDTFSAKIGSGPRDPDIPHRNFLPKDQ
jgi:hypothetical protein